MHHIYLNNTRREAQTPELHPALKLALSPIFGIVWLRHVTLGPPELSQHVSCWCRITRIANVCLPV